MCREFTRQRLDLDHDVWGGESPGSTRASLILQAREALLEKALAPQAHDFAPRMEARRDLVVAQVFGGEEVSTT